MKRLLLPFFSLFLLNLAPAKEPADYVDPSIGNVVPYLVPTFPTLHQPNQMLRTFPNREDYLDDQIDSFPLLVMHARMRGILQLRVSPGSITPASWDRRMSIDHDLQVMKPWFYEVYLLDDDITIQFAPGKKAGIFRFDFPQGKQKNILIDGSDQVTVSRSGNGFSLEESVTFVSRNNPARKPTTMSVWVYGEIQDLNGLPVPGVRSENNSGRLSLTCGPQSPSSLVFKYAVSYVSAEQALQNFESELRQTNLAALSSEARQAWEKVLNKVQVKGGTEAQRRTFYTALYRSHERMVNISEDGYYYSGYDEQVHYSDRPFYADDGIWDTYRALHPLRTILNPSMEEDMLHSFVRMCEQNGGWMPTYARVTGNRPCMTGYHSSAIFLDAYRKGLGRFDIETAYAGIRKNLTEGSWIPWRQGAPRTQLDELISKLGYMPALHPGEEETEPMVDPFERRQAVAITLARSYDTWVLSELAGDLGKEEDQLHFARISQEYKRLWHPEKRLYMPKDAQGNWIDIDPKLAGGRGFRDYYDENNGWTYAWYMHHDIPALKSLLGGAEAMVERLDELFREPLGIRKSDFYVNGSNSTGMVGQFSMGNETSLHIPYLYNYCGAPWKTQQRTRFLLDVWFKDNIFGTPGDDDGGAIAAWAVFTSMGFYQVIPGKPVYSLSSPVFTEVAIALPESRTFTILAPGSSRRNKYIQEAKLNGIPLKSPFLTHQQIMAGGTLELTLGEKPNRRWGVSE